MGLVHVWKDERDKPNIQIIHADRRSPHILHGYRNDDPKIKVVKVGVTIPRPQNYIEIRQGKKVYEQEANSPVGNFYRRIIGMLGGITQLTSISFEQRKTDNTLDATNNYPMQYVGSANASIESNISRGYYASADDDTMGIAVGSNTGNTAWDIENPTIDTLIQQGTAAGKLVYYAMAKPKIDYVGGVWTIYGRRLFDNFNADANTITVKEIVQFVPIYAGTVYKYIVIDERTVLVTPKDISYYSGAVLTYTKILTIPALTVLLPNGIALILSHVLGVDNYDSGNVYGSGHRAMKDTAGAVLSGAYSTIPNSSGNYIYGGTAGSVSKGITAGYGNTEVADTDYILDNEFTHGGTVNKLSYQAQDTPIGVYDSPSKTYTVTQSRTLTNSYAGNQDIAEIGIKGNLFHTTETNFLMSRSVLGSPVTLAQNDSISIIYDFSMVHA